MENLDKQLGVNKDRLATMIGIKEEYLDGKISVEEGNRLLREKIGTCTPDEFAYGEQSLKGKYNDETVTERMDDLLRLFDGVLIRASVRDYPEGSPLWAYTEEHKAFNALLDKAEVLLKAPKLIKNPWYEIFDDLKQWRIHLARKQNQLYPALEGHGFDRPTRIMWTFDDATRDSIAKSLSILETEDQEAFVESMTETIDLVRDLIAKEQEVLLPTANKLLSQEELAVMSRGDHDIGFALIPAPNFYGQVEETIYGGLGTNSAYDVVANSTHDAAASASNGASVPNAFLQDLAALVGKYTSLPGPAVSPTTQVNLNTGSMTLEQVNLMLKALPVDITYVDEEELVRYFNDTSARIFPRSPNVIGRDVMNCHPAQSREKVREVFDKFRAGLEDQAEAFIDKPGLFVYIIYVAVRDESGRFRGILEMVQDCTRIRAFSSAGRPGRQVIWGSEIGGPNDPGMPASSESLSTRATGGTFQGRAVSKVGDTQVEAVVESNTDEVEERDQEGRLIISAKTKMSTLIKQYPEIVDYMISLSPNYAKLKSPLAKVMMKVATLDMVAGRGGYSTDELVEKIKSFIEKQR